jgi:hypothetical protein
MLQKSVLIVSILCAINTLAFSPYENYLNSGEQKHAMLTAIAKTNNLAELSKKLPDLQKSKEFSKRKISNISCFF